jgi:hypothetical protein
MSKEPLSLRKNSNSLLSSPILASHIKRLRHFFGFRDA